MNLQNSKVNERSRAATVLMAKPLLFGYILVESQQFQKCLHVVILQDIVSKWDGIREHVIVFNVNAD